MKTLPKSAYYLVLTFAIAIYSGCKKETTEISSESQEYIATDTTSQSADTTSYGAVENQNTTGNAVSESGSSHQKTGSGKSTAKEKSNPLKGYSAPDGTDAENHDGDQYTKNDQKPMPSGTSIK